MNSIRSYAKAMGSGLECYALARQRGPGGPPGPPAFASLRHAILFVVCNNPCGAPHWARLWHFCLCHRTCCGAWWTSTPRSVRAASGRQHTSHVSKTTKSKIVECCSRHSRYYLNLVLNFSIEIDSGGGWTDIVKMCNNTDFSVIFSGGSFR